MEKGLKVIHYVNQFFGQLGGENKIDLAPQLKEGSVALGKQINNILGSRGEVVATIIAGDNYMAENPDKSAQEVVELLRGQEFDLLLAGPAFFAGRYGLACGAVCSAVMEQLGKPAVAAMYPENPGVDTYKLNVLIAPTGRSASGMRKDLPKLVALGLEAAAGVEIPTCEYINRGRRVNVFKDKRGSYRALDMLYKKMHGESFETELPMPVFDSIKPAPAIKDLSKAEIVLISTGGVVPMGNPEHMASGNSKKWCKVSIEGLKDFTEGSWEAIHAGYDVTIANADPDRVVPLDVAVAAVEEGKVGRLHPYYLYTVGNQTQVDRAKRFGEEIAAYMKENNINAAIMTST